MFNSLKVMFQICFAYFLDISLLDRHVICRLLVHVIISMLELLLNQLFQSLTLVNFATKCFNFSLCCCVCLTIVSLSTDNT